MRDSLVPLSSVHKRIYLFLPVLELHISPFSSEICDIMSHELLQSEAVIPNLPLTIECIAGYRIEDRIYRLFISTKEGHLLIYKITTKKGEANSKLERTIKSKQKSRVFF